MEVHKHPHHVTHTKKWFEYLLEFIMLFLAVYLGFVAENIRENHLNKEKEIEYMHSMIEDLKYDIARVTNNLSMNVMNCDGIDSLRFELRNAIGGKINANRIYFYYMAYGRNIHRAVTNTSAISQLKSSGSLRLIKNDSLLNDIMDYYERTVINIDNGLNIALTKRDDMQKTANRCLRWVYFDGILKTDTVFNITNKLEKQKSYEYILKMQPALTLLKTNTIDLEYLYNDLATYELAVHNYNTFIRIKRDEASSLIKHIQSIYPK